MKSALKLIFLVSILLYFFSVWVVSKLPNSSQIKGDLSRDPLQAMLSTVVPFDLDYRGTKYEIEPVANYDISGMIVSHNDIQAFDDIYHTSNSVDVRDLCLIWGENVQDDNHLSFNYKNEPWSCHITQKKPDSPGEFRGDNLSNNHLLVRSDSVRDKIYSLHPGDQIRLVGQLVNYGYPGEEPFRRTSQIRTDDGNGACEVMLVDSVEVLARWKPGWWKARMLSAKVALFSGIGFIASFILGPILENAKRKKETDAMLSNYNRRMGV